MHQISHVSLENGTIVKEVDFILTDPNSLQGYWNCPSYGG